jgi:hypothetical protein
MTLGVNLCGHGFPNNTFLFPARRQVAATDNLFGQAWREAPLVFARQSIVALGINLNGAALFFGKSASLVLAPVFMPVRVIVAVAVLGFPLMAGPVFFGFVPADRREGD